MNRRMNFLNGHIYHIYNRGNRKAEIFHDRHDYLYFLRQLREYLAEYPVTLIAYCLMPNHEEDSCETIEREKVTSDLGGRIFQIRRITLPKSDFRQTTSS